MNETSSRLMASFFGNERALFVALATGSVTGIGLMCKRLDEEKGGQLRCVNAFAAAYSWLVFLLSFEWLFLRLGGGSSLQALRAVLVADPAQALSGEDVAAGERICALLFAYMTQDVVVRFLHGEMDVRYIAHHVACLVGLVMALFMGHSPLYCVALAVSEFSTPVICLFEVAQTEGAAMDKYIEPCGVLLNLLFPLRVLWFSWTFYLWVAVYRPAPLAELSLDNAGYLSVCMLVLVNWSWWLKLLLGTVQVLLEGSNAAAKEKDH